MDDLVKIFEENDGFVIHKCLHYIDIYEKYFAKFRNTDVVILEMGIGHGGSLHMWKNYFGEKAKVYGVDKNYFPCINASGIEVIQGLFGDKEFLCSLKDKIPKLDILIDDGSHDSLDQKLIFEELFPHLVDGGIYCCEDTQTAYSEVYNGGYLNPRSFVEHTKNFIDYLNGYYREDDDVCVIQFKQYAFSLHYYPNILVIEKDALAYKRVYGALKTGKITLT